MLFAFLIDFTLEIHVTVPNIKLTEFCIDTKFSKY